MREYFYTFIFILCSSISFGQVENFKIHSKIKGDLNKDGLEDIIVISQDTMNSIAPFRLEIFFSKPDKSFDLRLTSDKAIEPQYPDGRELKQWGNGFSDVIISKGVISINYEFTRGHCEYKFRYQNKCFELIGYKFGNSNGRGESSSMDFNLSTGIRIEEVVDYTTDKVLSSKKKKIILKPLPKLEDFDATAENPYLDW
jgi:hypothetical protein